MELSRGVLDITYGGGKYYYFPVSGELQITHWYDFSFKIRHLSISFSAIDSASSRVFSFYVEKSFHVADHFGCMYTYLLTRPMFRNLHKIYPSHLAADKQGILRLP